MLVLGYRFCLRILWYGYRGNTNGYPNTDGNRYTNRACVYINTVSCVGHGNTNTNGYSNADSNPYADAHIVSLCSTSNGSGKRVIHYSSGG